MKRRRYQYGCLTKKHHAISEDVWQFRFYETLPDGQRARRARIVGTVKAISNRADALRAVESFRVWLNLGHRFGRLRSPAPSPRSRSFTSSLWRRPILRTASAPPRASNSSCARCLGSQQAKPPNNSWPILEVSHSAHLFCFVNVSLGMRIARRGQAFRSN